MSNQQDPPRLLSLTSQQVNIITEILQEVVTDLLSIDFSDPALDDATIRHHAAATGKRQICERLLRWDTVQLADFQQEIDQRSE